MHFNITMDNGLEIHGYLTPDGFSTEPTILVEFGGAHFNIKCDVYYPPAFVFNQHKTGIVGFKINEANTPGISSASDLSLTDPETGLTFYRRFNPDIHAALKVFRLETHYIPNAVLDRSLQSAFQFHAGSAENYGAETAREMLKLQNQQSVYVSGRLVMKSIENEIPKDCLTIASMYEPFYEFTARLAAISTLKRKNLSIVSERERIFFGPAIEYFDGLDLTDTTEVERSIKNAPKEVLSLFESPVLQQLVATSPSDKVTRDGVATALDTLSKFDFFAVDPSGADFSQDVAELTGLSPMSVRASSRPAVFLEIAEHMRKISRLEHLLESDLVLYHFVKQAEEKARS